MAREERLDLRQPVEESVRGAFRRMGGEDELDGGDGDDLVEALCGGV